MKVATSQQRVLGRGEGLRLQSGPGRDLIFKVTGEDTDGAFDYFIVEVAPHGGPPLHVHHKQEETIQVLKGKYKVRIGDETFRCEEGAFAYLPSRVPHAFLNLTDEPGEIVVVYIPRTWRGRWPCSAPPPPRGSHGPSRRDGRLTATRWPATRCGA